jgi:hypothetical protein
VPAILPDPWIEMRSELLRSRNLSVVGAVQQALEVKHTPVANARVLYTFPWQIIVMVQQDEVEPSRH